MWQPASRSHTIYIYIYIYIFFLIYLYTVYIHMYIMYPFYLPICARIRSSQPRSGHNDVAQTQPRKNLRIAKHLCRQECGVIPWVHDSMTREPERRRRTCLEQNDEILILEPCNSVAACNCNQHWQAGATRYTRSPECKSPTITPPITLQSSANFRSVLLRLLILPYSVQPLPGRIRTGAVKKLRKLRSPPLAG